MKFNNQCQLKIKLILGHKSHKNNKTLNNSHITCLRFSLHVRQKKKKKVLIFHYLIFPAFYFSITILHHYQHYPLSLRGD